MTNYETVTLPIYIKLHKIREDLAEHLAKACNRTSESCPLADITGESLCPFKIENGTICEYVTKGLWLKALE